MKPNDDLHAAIARRAEAAAKHTANAEALIRGRERLAGAEAEVARLTAEDEAEVARHARRLESQARGAETRPVPLLVPSDRRLADQITAARTHAAAVQMVASLVDAEQQSRAELAAAERAVQGAELAISTAAVRRLDERRTALLQELDAITEVIAAVAVDDPGAVPPDVAVRCSAQMNVLTIELALQQSPHIVRDIGTNRGPRLTALEAARHRWRAYRVQSLDAAPDPATPAACAA